MNEHNSYNLTKHKVRTLKDIAYDAISKNILSGDIPIGTRLKETELSEHLGISRGPIREALDLLEQDGFIYSIPNKGAIVAELISPEVDEVYIPIRRIVERYTLIKSPEILTEHHFEYLNSLIDSLAESYKNGDMEAVTKYDYEFHRYIISKCASPTLKSIWYSLSARITRRIFSQTQVTELAANVVQQHRDLLDSIKNNDQARLDILIQDHFI